MKKLGQITRYNKKKGVGIISDINGYDWYCYGYDLKKGRMYKFDIAATNDEIAVDLQEVSFPFRIRRYSLEENLLSFLVALVLGIILTVFLVQTVHADELSPKDKEHASTFEDTPVEEITMLAKLAHAEAHNQDVDGMRLVVAVVLNRKESQIFPDTIEEIINQPGQFAVISNGEYEKAIPEESDFEAVKQELEHRSDTEILYFTAGGYGFGKPAYKFKDHYFSTNL